MNSDSNPFEFIERQRQAGNPELERNYLDILRRSAQRHRWAAPVAAAWNGAVVRLRPRPGAIAVLGQRFPEMLLDLTAIRPIILVASSVQEVRFAVKHGIPFVLAGQFKPRLYAAYRAEEQRESLLASTLWRAKSLLRRLRPQALLLHQDSLPLERLFVLAARQLGIPSCTVQHGIFMESADPRAYDGQAADIVAVWGEYFRKLHVNALGPTQDVQVLGYPHPSPDRTVPPSEPSTLCILGQPWERYDPQAAEAKIEMVKHVLAAVNGRVRVVYRPHPHESREAMAATFPELAFTSPEESLLASFKRYGWYVSLTSTALVEAVMHGRIAIQTLDPRVPSDEFTKFGISAVVQNGSPLIAEIASRLPNPYRSVSEPPRVPDDVIHLPERIGERLVHILDAHSGADRSGS